MSSDPPLNSQPFLPSVVYNSALIGRGLMVLFGGGAAREYRLGKTREETMYAAMGKPSHILLPHLLFLCIFLPSLPHSLYFNKTPT